MAQSEDAYQSGANNKGLLFDPSRLSIQHSLNFGMSSNSTVSNLKSQSLYSTMLQYNFAAPVTVNLNFSLPIHSTYSSGQNLSMNNLQSLDYFRNMPFDFQVTWQPTDKMSFHINVARFSESDYYLNRLNPVFDYNQNLFHNYNRTSSLRSQP
jgi:hypothetical protein